MFWSEVTQSCPTLCNPMDCTLQGSSVHGIFQARVLEWVDISFSRGSSPPRDQTRVSRIAGRSFTVWATREYVLSIKQICQNQKQRQLSKNPFERRKHFLSSSKMGTIRQTFACTICSLSCFPASSKKFHKQIQLLLVIRIFSGKNISSKEIFVRIPPSGEWCVCVRGARGAA